MSLHELAGKPAPRSFLVNVPRLVSAYYTVKPDPSDPGQRVAFGTSGHRGSSLRGSFNEDHILATSQALVEHRRSRRASPGRSSSAWTRTPSPSPRSPPRSRSSPPTGSRCGSRRDGATRRRPAISHAILTWNRGRKADLADGVVVTPSHNPPDDGGFKYNPPDGGPAGTRHHEGGRVAGQRDPGGRAPRREAREPREGAPRRDHARARLRGPVRRRPGERPRHGRDRRGEAPDRRRSPRRRLRGLLGAHRRALRHRPRRREPGRGPDLLVHDPRQGRQDPDGLLVPLRHGRPHRPEGPLRRGLRQRRRRRPPRHRHARPRAS